MNEIGYRNRRGPVFTARAVAYLTILIVTCVQAYYLDSLLIGCGNRINIFFVLFDLLLVISLVGKNWIKKQSSTEARQWYSYSVLLCMKVLSLYYITFPRMFDNSLLRVNDPTEIALSLSRQREIFLLFTLTPLIYIAHLMRARGEFFSVTETFSSFRLLIVSHSVWLYLIDFIDLTGVLYSSISLLTEPNDTSKTMKISAGILVHSVSFARSGSNIPTMNALLSTVAIQSVVSIILVQIPIAVFRSIMIWQFSRINLMIVKNIASIITASAELRQTIAALNVGFEDEALLGRLYSNSKRTHDPLLQTFFHFDEQYFPYNTNSSRFTRHSLRCPIQYSTLLELNADTSDIDSWSSDDESRCLEIDNVSATSSNPVDTSQRENKSRWQSTTKQMWLSFYTAWSYHTGKKEAKSSNISGVISEIVRTIWRLHSFFQLILLGIIAHSAVSYSTLLTEEIPEPCLAVSPFFVLRMW